MDGWMDVVTSVLTIVFISLQDRRQQFSHPCMALSPESRIIILLLPQHFIIYSSAETSKWMVILLCICWICWKCLYNVLPLYVPFHIRLIHKKSIYWELYKHQPHVHSFQLAGWRRDGCWRWDGSEKGSCFASQILRWFLKSAFRKSIVLQYMQW